MFELAILAFLLGMKHSYDTDHLVAVSNYLVKSHSIKNTLRLSSYWAIGHMLTAGVITVVLYAFRETLLQTYLGYFEIAVAIMLIALGIYSFKELLLFRKRSLAPKKQSHFHEEHLSHHHIHLLGIGIVHGLTSNDELLLLFTLSLGITSLLGILSGVVIFSLGVVLGMTLFGIALTAPFLKVHSEKIKDYVGFVAGALSLIYGFYLLAQFLS